MTSIKTITRWCFYILFFLTPLLMNSKTSEIFEFNKIIFIYVMTTVITAVSLIEFAGRPQSNMFKSPLAISLLLFLVSQILSTVISIDTHTSIFGYYGRFNGGLLSIIAYVLLFFSFLQTFEKKDIATFLKISLYASLAVMLWGLPGKVDHDMNCLLFTGQWSNACWTDQFRPAERMFSTLGQPNWMGAYLAINLFIGLYFFILSLIPAKQDVKTKKSSTYGSNLQQSISAATIFYGVYVVLNFACILFTRSRSSLVAAVVGLVLFGGVVYYKRKGITLNAHVYKVLAGVFGAIMLITLFSKTGIEKIDRFIPSIPTTPTSSSLTAATPAKPATQNHEEATPGVTDSFDIRKIVWKGAIDLGLRYPLFGTGVETFAYSYYFTRPVEHNLTSEWDFLYNKAHNEFLNYFATTGFIGLLSYLSLIGLTGWLYIRHLVNTGKQNPLTVEDSLLLGALLGSYITILITNFFGFSTTTVSLFFYIIPAIPLVLNKKEMKEPEKEFSTLQGAVTTGVVIVGIFVLSYLYQYYNADLTYAQANAYVAAESYQKALNSYDDALKLKYEHVYEDKLSYVLANLAFVASYQKDTELTSKLVMLADGYNQKSLRSAPQNVLYWKTRAKNLYLFYQISQNPEDLEKAIQALRTATELSPTDPKLYHSIGLFYSALSEKAKTDAEKKDYEAKAMKEVNYALKLKPDYIDGLDLKKEIVANATLSAKEK